MIEYRYVLMMLICNMSEFFSQLFDFRVNELN
jgi:hypothetical protein